MSSNLPANILKQLQLAEMRRHQETAAGYGEGQGGDGAHYKDFTASELYCGKCRKAMPVREKLLLSLPDGNLYDYLCTGCGSSVGTKK